jgi:hypothetical protein
VAAIVVAVSVVALASVAADREFAVVTDRETVLAVDAAGVLVAVVFDAALLHALSSAAPPATAKSWRRDTSPLRPAAPSSSDSFVCSSRFVIVDFLAAFPVVDRRRSTPRIWLPVDTTRAQYRPTRRQNGQPLAPCMVRNRSSKRVRHTAGFPTGVPSGL